MHGDAVPEFVGKDEDDDLLRAAEELGIDLSGGLGGLRREDEASADGESAPAEVVAAAESGDNEEAQD